jgi:hypothetical protein
MKAVDQLITETYLNEIAFSTPHINPKEFHSYGMLSGNDAPNNTTLTKAWLERLKEFEDNIGPSVALSNIINAVEVDNELFFAIKSAIDMHSPQHHKEIHTLHLPNKLYGTQIVYFINPNKTAIIIAWYDLESIALYTK